MKEAAPTTPRGRTAQISERSIDSPPYVLDRSLLSPKSVLITDVFSLPSGPAAWAIISGPSPGNTCFGRMDVDRLEASGVSFRSACRQRVTGAYRELLTHFHPLHERSRLANDTEYTYMTTLSPEENELRRGLEIFSEWSKWILTERGKSDELERAIGEVLIPPYGMFPCCVQLQAQWVEYEDVLAPALGEKYVRNHVMVRDPGPNDRFVEWPASEEWSHCHRVFADDIAKVTGDALFPWTFPNVNIVPSRAYFHQKRKGPAQEPLAAKEAMPPLGEGLSISDDGLFIMCAWGLAVNRWVTHVFNFVYREYSAVSQSDMYLIKDYYALRIAVLQRLAKWENVVATMKKYPKGSYGTANLFLRTGGLPPQRIGPADQARWRNMERDSEARKMER